MRLFKKETSEPRDPTPPASDPVGEATAARDAAQAKLDRLDATVRGRAARLHEKAAQGQALVREGREDEVRAVAEKMRTLQNEIAVYGEARPALEAEVAHARAVLAEATREDGARRLQEIQATVNAKHAEVVGHLQDAMDAASAAWAAWAEGEAIARETDARKLPLLKIGLPFAVGTRMKADKSLFALRRVLEHLFTGPASQATLPREPHPEDAGVEPVPLTEQEERQIQAELAEAASAAETDA